MFEDFCSCDDGERPTVYEPSDVMIARVEHRCYECGHAILPGESYRHVFAVYPTMDGAETMRTCAWCMEMEEWIKAIVPCFCFLHGNLHESVAEVVDHYQDQTAGLRFGFNRRRYEISKRPRLSAFPSGSTAK